MIDVYCLQEARWKRHSSKMMEMKGSIRKLWLAGKVDEVGVARVMLKEELCERILEARRVSDEVIGIVLVFEKDVLRLTCAKWMKFEE